MTNRKELDAQLAAINAEVESVIAKRRAWMNAHMPDYARYKVGEVIFDADTGRRLGTVSKLYRYYDDRDPRYDTSMDISYEYHTGGNCYDNTSRQIGLRICNREELAAQRLAEYEFLTAHDERSIHG